MTTVWALFREVPYEHGQLFGIYSTEHLALQAKKRALSCNLQEWNGAPLTEEDLHVQEMSVDGIDNWPM